ncbi:shikimate kinase [Nostoc sp. UIC 10630]|uniref:shikimate kinase n=1 Tax=Nostoc sp. UIC 10630 TaxID=2100146 RepID=UPI0013D5FD5B|nr:shikimate kinase [Nostoc sp. UIC 10630]NEU79887.1 shikimate kinase [Nostoc sp. UIC 10630]
MSLPEKTIIYLIGMMGAGKTTTAPLISQHLGYGFTDTDREVEKAKGKSCHEIVDQIGVDGFRILETQVLAEIAKRKRLVVACGGGIILRDENWRYLRQDNAVVVWLNLPLEEIHKRIKNELRPNLRGLNSEQLTIKLEEIFENRKTLYAKLSDICIKAAPAETPEKLATKIIDELNNFYSFSEEMTGEQQTGYQLWCSKQMTLFPTPLGVKE